MYEIVGIITMWLLRIGLLGLFIYSCIDASNFKGNITRHVPTENDTWKIRPLTWREFIREQPGIIGFIAGIFALDALAWATYWLF